MCRETEADGWLQPLCADAGLAEPHALTAPEQRVGRTELKTSRKLVSKAHAILAHSAAGAATVEDRSVNGTYLNGARLPQNDPAPLQHGDVVTLLDRVCVPLPQLWVHGVQSLNADATQSTGHGCSLHGCVSFKAGHATPPCAACVVIVRCRILKPPPHDWLHVELAPQSDTTQSTGQSCVLHARFWLTSVLHDTPPF